MSAPLLHLVTNGASDRPGPGRTRDFIRCPAAATTTYMGFSRSLHAVNYTGPVGLQCYNLKGEPRANLEAAHRAWVQLTADFAQP